MSEILIGVDPTRPDLAFKQDTPNEEKASQLPQPRGYALLCAIPEVEETFASGIVKADSTRQAEETTTMVLFVVSMGDLAYQDATRFPSGPWCSVGDFILTRPYAGVRVKIHGREFRLINDDNVLAVVDDPRGYGRC
jgi:co-chaperonin GroES (HSP10)